MKETLEGVEEIFDKRGATDATQTFERLWSITEELMVKIRARFELTRDPSTEDLAECDATGHEGNGQPVVPDHAGENGHGGHPRGSVGTRPTYRGGRPDGRR